MAPIRDKGSKVFDLIKKLRVQTNLNTFLYPHVCTPIWACALFLFVKNSLRACALDEKSGAHASLLLSCKDQVNVSMKREISRSCPEGYENWQVLSYSHLMD